MSQAVKQATHTLDNLVGPVDRLKRSLKNPSASFPLGNNPDTEALADEIDQFLQRFSQVADITLRKLFPHVAEAYFAIPAPQFFRDMLDQLERAEVIDAAAWWVQLNESRNRLVHEYAMEPGVRNRELNAAWFAAPMLVAQIERVRALMERQ